MDTNGKPAGGAGQSAGAVAVAALAADLNSLVDQLELDWNSRQLIARQTAGQLHELRTRAEWLLGEK